MADIDQAAPIKLD